MGKGMDSFQHRPRSAVEPSVVEQKCCHSSDSASRRRIKKGGIDDGSSLSLACVRPLVCPPFLMPSVSVFHPSQALVINRTNT
ncbi:uncharacterized protein BDZ83DRAFT_626608 [Colletotrichum acutatum]|uniref:Uncharacterized protein n=1 Tax=Glomerella acutata TaxID=27357 RepID=A0AAD8UK75_GLOAC|nr:uncharacterized protein BDZ83DRAFT_626608 [Colletotrichum acutatum]KAK1723260.1 hypothetical protein BDZ83DRAFT_626608 [Colletotrichum acutatum]